MTRFTTPDGVTLAYRLVGEGPYLLCQPGGPGRASSYLRDLAGLDRTRTLVLLDSRGTGDSDRPPPEHLTWPHLVGDLDALREHLGADTVDVLGHSAGAVVAQAYAAAHPHRIQRLVLVTPSGRLQLDDPAPDTERIVRARTDIPEAVEAYLKGESPALRPALYGRWDDDIRAHAYGADTEMDDVAERSFNADPQPDRAAIVQALTGVTSPVLVVAGDRDGATGVESAYAVAASFPNARVDVLPGVGHFPWVEVPERFRSLVAEFLETPV
ncbi:MAG TPA: alpha/beta hydrolase [Frankiaceae bacterium]|nr:alpha/beta hydrolase [Frankiaceae bacterium]